MPIEAMRTNGAAAECARTDGAPSMSSLVTGIVSDAQQLIRDEVALARQEIKEELVKAKMALVLASGGLALVALSAILLSFFLVHLLHQVTGGGDPAIVPLWAWFLIWGVVFLLGGGGLLAAAYSNFKNINLVPRQTVETMKENVRWLKNQT
ncbi:MAG TPA: phage holin family protein [Gemmataceae bacterium]|nr:phage holin family protein [Gemmataceae bacterium]